MPDLIETMPNQGGGPATPEGPGATTPLESGSQGTPAEGDKTQPSQGPDKVTPTSGELPGDKTTVAPDTTAAKPSTPARDPALGLMESKLSMMEGLLGKLMDMRQAPASAPASTPSRDFGAELEALGQQFQAEKISQPDYMAKAFAIMHEQAKAEAAIEGAAGAKGTLEEVKSLLGQSEAKQRLDAFYQKYPDAVDFEKTPEFTSLKRENGMHDPFSAFFAHKWQQAEAAKDQAVRDAVAAKEAEMVKNFKAKGAASVVGAQGGGAPKDAAEAYKGKLKNAGKFGGTTRVLAEKLRAMRSGS